MNNKELERIYIVALVYERHNGKTLDKILRQAAILANSEEEATGVLMGMVKDEVKGYSLIMNCSNSIFKFLNFDEELNEEIKIEDFHIGFEYEELIPDHERYLPNGPTWMKRIYSYESPKLMKIKKYIDEGKVRKIN